MKTGAWTRLLAGGTERVMPAGTPRRRKRARGPGSPRSPHGPYAHSADNASVVLTGADPASCSPTADPYDRAHLTYRKDSDGVRMLVPAGVTGPRNSSLPRPGLLATPRLYHPSQMASSGVGFDSSFDDWAARAIRLQAQGIPMGVRLQNRREETPDELAAAWESTLDPSESLRDKLRQRTSVRVPRAEREAERSRRELEREATRIIQMGVRLPPLRGGKDGGAR